MHYHKAKLQIYCITCHGIKKLPTFLQWSSCWQTSCPAIANFYYKPLDFMLLCTGVLELPVYCCMGLVSNCLSSGISSRRRLYFCCRYLRRRDSTCYLCMFKCWFIIIITSIIIIIIINNKFSDLQTLINTAIATQEKKTNTTFACGIPWIIATTSAAAFVRAACETARPTARTQTARMTAWRTARVSTAPVAVVTTTTWVPATSLAAAAAAEWRMTPTSAIPTTTAASVVKAILWPSLIHRTSVVVYVVYSTPNLSLSTASVFHLDMCLHIIMLITNFFLYFWVNYHFSDPHLCWG